MAKIDDDTIQGLTAAGYEMGLAFAAGMARGIADGFAAMAEGAEMERISDSGAQDAPPDVKTRIEDCRACWCDTCAYLEHCKQHRDGARRNGQPLPCVGCVNGERFKPREALRCVDYIALEGHNYE